ncbi:MAG: VWA domain-containing protein [Gammaproteobacteria bacterium]|nr:VWA domain-containing protein [Gammaproteobacteria bacterium]
MKNPFRPDQKQSTSSSKTDKLPVSGKQDVQAFLSKVAALPQTGGDARLIFSLDATASRQATWDVASQLQTDMFLSAQALGGLHVQLCYFRGFADFYASSWQSGSKELLRVMSGIHCQAGVTQLERVLRHALTENAKQKIKCVIYIGDAMEENLDILAHLAGKLGLLNIPVFMFQERNDPITQRAFVEISRLSGGAYSQFDAASADQLRELLRAVAIYAAGGLKALQNFSKTATKSVKLLQQQLKS